jgi:competence protein ComEA
MSWIRQSLVAVCLLLVSFAAFATSVDINTADANTLASELTGVGKAKAEAIVSYRQTHGPFARIDDLAKVKGIGIKTVEKNRAKLVLTNE